MKPIALCLVCLTFIVCVKAQIPHLKNNGNATQLIVNGKPFLMLAGEANNSSGSDIEYMARTMKDLSKSNLNSLLVSVSWEIIEPKEGFFDFKSVDELIRLARANNLKLGLLWFGAWKNGLSPYAPSWVLGDVKRFQRVKYKNGENSRILTPLCAATMNADAKAYSALMQHIATIDAAKSTVIVMQVENEVGVLGDTRDFSPEANKAFTSQVPQALIQYLVRHKNTLETEIKAAWESSGAKTSGSWSEVFGANDQTDLFFMAWNYSHYNNTIAAAGKKNYNIPMYSNCWMPNPRPNPGKPGNYPSGGPIITVLDIWKANAPAIDMIGPDLYGADYKDELKNFHRADNPMFIPETNTTEGPGTYAFAEHNAICFSPFGIDNKGNVMAREYGMLKQLMPVITKYQGTGKMFGIYKSGTDTAKSVKFKLNNDVTVTIHYQQGGGRGPAGATAAPANPQARPAAPPACYGLFIQTGENEFMVAGFNLSVTASSTNPAKQTWLKDAWQGNYVNGIWIPIVLNNGDEAGFLRSGDPVYGIRAYRANPADAAIIKFKVVVYDK
jgi:hypothetical protein